MSFKCEKCGKPQPARTKPERVVTETCVVQHRDPTYRDGEYQGRRDTGTGTQIVSEASMCGPCALQIKFDREGSI